MNLKKFLLPFCILACVAIIPAITVSADTDTKESAYLLINTSTNAEDFKKFPITDDLTLTPDINGVLAITTGDDTINVNISDIHTIGIAKEIQTGIDANIANQGNKTLWEALTIKGETIDKDCDLPRMLSNLRPYEVYIITNGTKTFKFIPYK